MSLVSGVGDVRQNCGHPPIAGFLRVIVGWNADVSKAHVCALQARNAGIPVLLVVQWDNHLSQKRIVQRFRTALALYREVQPFAVAVGNEQEGPWNGGPACNAVCYARVWDAVEPMIARGFPHAIRVAGEVTPWSDAFMKDTAAIGLPGAQAYDFHAYPADVPSAARGFAAIARAHHVQAWADEGLCGPNAWMGYGCSSSATLRRLGFSLAGEWYVAPTVGPVRGLRY